MKQFSLEYWEDEGWYVGRLVEIPGIFSQGESLEALKENIQEAYEMMLKAEPSSIVPETAHRVILELGS
jgi:predicted RNase H-like HicB family nuclease